ncbi:protein phosphatase type 1 complex subunit Hex2/Reg1 [Diplogelasinospora grovesii]|uniref:Protein phosphatase type 1 complex subunit Hex2/Reg1 n=1 Tax=Diplogelasinospora grovesii TaxID=303347 RepID=A0AAN6NHM8_9PEZI|nr:protein phosphatase type 1 complex subunit Hex2/Reg1 [Diplogelasinospora grovesii]
MAVVLSSEESSYFSSATLRRSHSQPKFVTKQSGFHTSSSASRISDLYSSPPARHFLDSTTSSAPSSPQATHAESTDLSCTSTPATNSSLASDCDEEEENFGSVTSEDHIHLPCYDDVDYYKQAEGLESAPSSRADHSHLASPNDQDESTGTSRPGSPEACERAEDDISLRPQPSRHVDYLSHNWREEDIWSSWKLIVSRRGDYANAARLENASWRTWMKSKNKLSTVSPETLNWLKECDVTWLYGPLQPGTVTLNNTSSSSTGLSKSNSFVQKKPILKKRSMSEIMLQRSLSALSLVKQAAEAAQAQQKEGLKRIGRRPGLERAATDFMTFPFSSRRGSNFNSLFPSTASSGVASPSSEKKHIHFNEQVAQCIAVDVKGDDDDDDVDPDPFMYGSDSDDDAIMMKRTKAKKWRPVLRRAKSSNPSAESKTIAMLPSTTLKYREDTPEPTETAMKHSTSYRSPIMSPSSSQETLRPSKKSGKLFIADDDDDDEEDEHDDEPDWRFSTKLGESSSGLKRSTSSSSLTAEPAGMRRTASGMFMPYEEGESASTSEGLFGRVIDTVNTARDIAHVIWNVGWRK